MNMRKSSFVTLLIGAALVAGCAAPTSKTVGSSVPAVSASVQPSAAPDPTTPSDASSSDPAALTTDLPLGTLIHVTGSDTDNSGTESKFAFDVTPNAHIKSSNRAVDDFTGPPTNGRYIGIQVTYRVTVGKYAPNYFDWTLRSTAGDTFTQNSVYMPALDSGTVRHGKSARGWLTFDVAPGAYTLEFRSDIMDSDPASWKLTVK